ncbi:MAG: short-chain dehydrogenase [Alphaproteobacteria bacterium]|nr:MAG: short-chain dehydrogenase [Alphaproteobacteria bacterium]
MTPSRRQEVALVTGAASGIGRAVAMRLASRGAALGLVDRNREALEQVAGEIIAGGGKSRWFGIDVTNSASLASAVDDFAGASGGLDTAVSCAGIAREGLVHEFAIDDWNAVIAVNLTGTFLLAHFCVPWLLKRNEASFVAISSDAGIQGAQGYAAYAASKHGVIGLVRCMALDYGPRGLRSNVVCPAFVETPMATEIFGRAPAGTKEFYEKCVPLGRFARPEEVAKVVAHLTSDEASYSNGMVYSIDGGATAGYFEHSG